MLEFFLPPTLPDLDSLPVTVVQQQEVVPPAQSQIFKISEEFRVEYQAVSQDLSTGIMVFSGGVKAFYGLTEISADELVLDIRKEKGTAKGNVVIRDPEGMIRAQDMDFDWAEGRKGGTAYNAVVEVGHVTAKAESVVVNPDVWLLTNATVSLDDLERGRTRLDAREVEIILGDAIIARHAYVVLLGQKLGPVPEMKFNLDRRIYGLRLPSLGIRSDGRVGTTWQSSILVSEYSSVGAKISAFPRERPSYQMEYVYSPLDSRTANNNVRPANDLDERFQEGWFNHIGVRDPFDEFSALSAIRESYSIGFAYHVPTKARTLDSEDVSKAVDLAVERGGVLGDLGWRSQFRLQRIQETNGSDWLNRGTLGISTSLTPYDLGNGFYSTVRIDGQGFLSEDNTSGFGRLQAGFVSPSLGGVRLGAAYVIGGEFGQFDFGFDRLGVLEGVHLRADYRRGPYALSFLSKYDVRSGEWFDHEWEFAFAAGSFEPYFGRRSFPGEFRFGVRLRLDDLIERMQTRDLNRRPK